MAKQQQLPIPRPIHPDRNAAQGGKSFYFFDLDENVFSVESAHYVFHKTTNEMREVPGKIFWESYDDIGKKGFLKDYEVRADDLTGSFRRFRDMPDLHVTKQPLIEDLTRALDIEEFMGPSWNQFHHAVLNQRPLALITARGHHPDTIKTGMSLFKDKGILPAEPNYLAVLPVSHPEISNVLGGGTIPELKRKAIRYAVELAFETYGRNDFHRFGMSDDDPKNVQKIIEEFIALKKDYPKNAFFIIETARGQVNKWEIFPDHAEKSAVTDDDQLKLL
jgi:hypothetical protein